MYCEQNNVKNCYSLVLHYCNIPIPVLAVIYFVLKVLS